MNTREVFKSNCSQEQLDTRGMIEHLARENGIPPSCMEKKLIEEGKLEYNWGEY
jgi:hypothetical protein